MIQSHPVFLKTSTFSRPCLAAQPPHAALHLYIRATVHSRKELAQAAYPGAYAGRFWELEKEDLIAMSKTELVALVRRRQHNHQRKSMEVRFTESPL